MRRFWHQEHFVIPTFLLLWVVTPSSQCHRPNKNSAKYFSHTTCNINVFWNCVWMDVYYYFSGSVEFEAFSYIYTSRFDCSANVCSVQLSKWYIRTRYTVVSTYMVATETLWIVISCLTAKYLTKSDIIKMSFIKMSFQMLLGHKFGNYRGYVTEQVLINCFWEWL